MIPKIIHYCWFGRCEKPKLAKKCIESWKKFCPDYEIIEWNEDNFDVNMNAYTQKCYQEKKYAFLSDYIRLLIIKKYGGIYLDTDVEIIKNFDDLLLDEAFFGFENNEFINTGEGFGAEADNPIVNKMLNEYDALLDGKSEYIGCPILNTKAILDFGLIQNGEIQNLKHGTVYPADYFNPYDDPTGRLKATSNTYSIHWYSKSWLPIRVVFFSKITRIIHRIFGADIKQKIFKIFKNG